MASTTLYSCLAWRCLCDLTLNSSHFCICLRGEIEESVNYTLDKYRMEACLVVQIGSVRFTELKLIFCKYKVRY